MFPSTIALPSYLERTGLYLYASRKMELLLKSPNGPIKRYTLGRLAPDQQPSFIYMGHNFYFDPAPSSFLRKLVDAHSHLETCFAMPSHPGVE